MKQNPVVSKTRERLIEVARQLFLRNGVEKTTMADIANASDKGRRTVYTYFRNKREIHQAVLESESEQMVSRLRQIQCSDASCAEKLERMIRARLEIKKSQPDHMPSRQSDISIDFRLRLGMTRSEKVRRMALLKEIEIFKKILAEGIDCGEFNSEQALRLQSVMLVLALGVDNPNASPYLNIFGLEKNKAYGDVISFMIDAVRRLGNSRQSSKELSDNYSDIHTT